MSLVLTFVWSMLWVSRPTPVNVPWVFSRLKVELLDVEVDDLCALSLRVSNDSVDSCLN